MPSRTSKHRLAPPDATSGYCGTEPQAHSLLTFCRYSLWRVSALFVSVQIHTKYSCVNCTVIICNVCSVPAQEHELGYRRDIHDDDDSDVEMTQIKQFEILHQKWIICILLYYLHVVADTLTLVFTICYLHRLSWDIS